MVTQILANTGSCDGLLPDNAKLLYETMLTYDLLVLCNSYGNNFREVHMTNAKNYTFKSIAASLVGQWLNYDKD